MTACAICGISFAANVPIQATLKLHRRKQLVVQRWLFCGDCFGKLKIDLGELAYIPCIGLVIRNA